MRVILDAGPLVAYFNRNDAYHVWAKDLWTRIQVPMLTCEAVLAEASFLVSDHSGGARAVLDLVKRGVIDVSFSLTPEAESVSRLLDKYRNVPMSLADACLVRMAELHPTMPVFTLDNDFQLYRKNARQVIPTLSPN